MKHLKHMWPVAPKILRSLLIAVLIVTLAGMHSATLAARRTTSQVQSPSSDTQLMAARALPGVYSVPSSCSVPIIPAIVTENEIELRQYQADFAKFIEEQAKLDREASLTLQRDVLSIERFRLDCEIKVLQARQSLQTGSAVPLPRVSVTPQEIELRKRQLAIAKQIDAEEGVAQEAGIASINSVWAARRNRIDAEILLLQATVQQRLQNT
ncbi:hypothetical protein IQ260_11900 [Leptolyngbya cf. ectocarpi LEGE 11479]|uniref:Uncharacterized protein n=1 Tax=Leptolyngbya cf. ectocarpi LEGE 11479 TaxID=1828722 RepID=A0A929F939_LEPEC|nr:hypothetical protein [Leptolyngbya ectocarpi]MBE9067359.1 hypothetical protein [Leptolyngbya cf. ectocarpi LEGE 11479]